VLDWDELIQKCTECQECELGKTRKNIVIERGSRNAPLMLVGEGPGEQEDNQGRPFVGAAGQLLDLLLSALSLEEKDYYICNIVKCRPPDNRVPFDEEAAKCIGFLRNQLVLVKPEIIVCMGSTAAKHIIDKDAKISQIRGRWVQRKGYWIMPTFHPAALLRDVSKKGLMFDDLRQVVDKLAELRGE
jgi:DNA polymerase